MPTAPTVVLEKYSFLESPRWWEDRIWVSDFYTHRVLSAREDGSDVRVEAQVPGQPSGLGRLPDGRLLVVSMRDHRVLRREPSGELVTHADLSDHATGLLNETLRTVGLEVFALRWLTDVSWRSSTCSACRPPRSPCCLGIAWR